MIILAFVILILLNAVSDGTLNKPTKHILSAFHVLGWLLFPVFIFYTEQWQWVTFPDFLVMLLGYACLRYFLFDFAWNIARGQRIDYVGHTSFYDKLIGKVHPSFVLLTKIIAAILGVSLLINCL
jgi:hypothetical protein